MKKVDHLQQELEQQSVEAVLNGLPYIAALRCFSKVVASCFGNILADTYMEDIKMFKDAYMALEITVTPKVFFKTVDKSKCIFNIFRLISHSSIFLH